MRRNQCLGNRRNYKSIRKVRQADRKLDKVNRRVTKKEKEFPHAEMPTLLLRRERKLKMNIDWEINFAYKIDKF